MSVTATFLAISHTTSAGARLNCMASGDPRCSDSHSDDSELAMSTRSSHGLGSPLSVSTCLFKNNARASKWQSLLSSVREVHIHSRFLIVKKVCYGTSTQLRLTLWHFTIVVT